jgi:hypothetical protein
MIVLGAARWVGIGLILVPVPIVLVLLVAAARAERANGFLATCLALTLVPAIWLSALRFGWGGCSECLHDYKSGAMLLVGPSLPLLVAAGVLLFRGQYAVPAALVVAAQGLLAIGLAKVNTPGFVFVLVLVVLELMYVLFTEIARRSMAGAGEDRV